MGSDLRLAIVDLDGVAADVRHRLHKLKTSPQDWEALVGATHPDPIHEEGVALDWRLTQSEEPSS